MKRILTTVALVLGLLLLLMPITVNATSGIEVTNRTGDGIWDGDTWEVSIAPSESRSTTLTLYNSSGNSLEVEIPLPSSLDSGNITFELSKANFIMPSGSYTNITLTVKASGSATPGTYTTELVEIKFEIILAPLPSPPQPIPPEPEVEEPEEEKPTEPVVVEPTEPTEPEPVEPEEPIEPEEPVEPEEPSEPEEPIEPEGPVEPEGPTEPEDEGELGELTPVEEPCRWSLLDTILACLVAIMLGLDIWQWRRRRK